MKGLSRRALAVATVATLGIGSALVASMTSIVPAAAGGGGGGGGCGPGSPGCGAMNITIGPKASLSADGNAVTLMLSFTCSPNPSDATPAFSGGIGSQVQQIQGKELAFGFGGGPIFAATCDGTTVNTVAAVVNPAVFGPSPSPPFKNGKASAQAGGGVCDMNQLNPTTGTPLFCDGGGTSPTLIMLH